MKAATLIQSYQISAKNSAAVGVINLAGIDVTKKTTVSVIALMKSRKVATKAVK